MKKIISIFTMLLVVSGAVGAYEVDANSVFGVGRMGLRPYSRYTITCPSIIENATLGDRANLRLFYLDNEPFEGESSKRAANTLVIKTFNPSASSFELTMQDGNKASVNYDINNKHKKMGAIAGYCRIEP